MEKLDYFVINGTRVRVEYSETGADCCDKCCFGIGSTCQGIGEDRKWPCEKFDYETAYFVPAKRHRTWADVAVAMVALAIIALIGILCSCERRSPESEAQQTTQEIDRHIKKATIDGHDYLLFFGKVSSAPTVIHSESCPCKSENKQNHE